MTDWRAPGHILWGNTPDHTTSNDKWLPEGSLYSPEDFSCALHQAHREGGYVWHVDTVQDSCAIVDTSFDKYVEVYPERLILSTYQFIILIRLAP